MFKSILAELDANQANPLIAFKQTVKAADGVLIDAFHAGRNVADLVHGRAAFVDAILHRAWQQHMPADTNACLIAVGGYGRAELHPGSDIDLLLLTKDDPQTLADAIAALITFLWDIGLEVAHSVRDLAQCVEEAQADVTVMTNLLESRPLAGASILLEQLKQHTSADRIWPSDAFFSAKLDEQNTRHAKNDDSGYKLEPNVKTNPGGLRDIQMIGWVAKRHFAVAHLIDLQQHGFLTRAEYHSLKSGEHFLWKIRFALHVLTGRYEDRLLFEHQRELAPMLGYQDANANLAVEHFMQDYYRTVLKLERLNEMLLQLFREAILQANQLGEPAPINRRFQARGGYIEVINPAIFARHPLAMLEIFLLLEQHPELQGVRANTIRAIRAHRHLINDKLRQDIRARSLFMEILRQPQGITHVFRRMHRYGILSRYWPAFKEITGLMQFDLFHVYTVDEHILMVLRNMRRFTLPEFQHECAACHAVWQHIPKPELLYLACLFHDIAKGRGGDHSTLGAADARAFCAQHKLSNYDSALVAWLVEKHLVMSSTAQRKDIDDPEVVLEFAHEVGTIQRLHHLYLLTVADMRGTNPARWNSWKSALLQRLYERTLTTLQRGLDRPQNENQLIQATQQQARELLTAQDFDDRQITLCWGDFFSIDYFLQTPAQAVAWHTTLLLQQPHAQMQAHLRQADERGCNEIFLFGPDHDGLFAQTATLLDQMAVNIQAARVAVSTRNIAISSLHVLEQDGTLLNADRGNEIIHYLNHRLNESAADIDPGFTRRMPRQLKSFTCNTQIHLSQDAARGMTVLNITTHDRPGLLALVGAELAEHKLRVYLAQVTTEGAIAHDRFSLTDSCNQPITGQVQLDALKSSLIDRLDN